MSDWTAEGSMRLIAAVIAAHDLKPTHKLKTLAKYYGEGATAKAIEHQMRKIKHMVDKLKLDLNHDAPKEAQIAKLDKKEKDTASQLKGKSTRSRVSTMKSNGIINGRVKKSATRAVRKSASPGIAAAIMEMTLQEEEEEPVEGIGGSFVIVNDEHEDNAIVEEEEHATKDKQQDGKDNGGSLVVNDKYEDSASGQPLEGNEIHDRGGMEWTASEVNDALEASMMLMFQCDF